MWFNPPALNSNSPAGQFARASCVQSTTPNFSFTPYIAFPNHSLSFILLF